MPVSMSSSTRTAPRGCNYSIQFHVLYVLPKHYFRGAKHILDAPVRAIAKYCLQLFYLNSILSTFIPSLASLLDALVKDGFWISLRAGSLLVSEVALEVIEHPKPVLRCLQYNNEGPRNHVRRGWYCSVR